MPSYMQTLVAAGADGPPITNSTTQISVIPTDCKYTLPANTLRVGSQLKMTFAGRISNVVTTPGTLLFDCRFGAVVVFNSAAAAIALNTTAKTNVPFWAELLLTCRAVGSGTAANMMGQLKFNSESVLGVAANNYGLTAYLPASAPAVGTGFDSTVSNLIDLQAKFSVATATTALTIHQYQLELGYV